MFSVFLTILGSRRLSIFAAVVFWNIFRKEDTLYNGCSVCVSVADGAVAIAFPGVAQKRNRNWETAKRTHTSLVHLLWCCVPEKFQQEWFVFDMSLCIVLFLEYSQSSMMLKESVTPRVSFW